MHLLPVSLSCLNQRLGSATSALSPPYKGMRCKKKRLTTCDIYSRQSPMRHARTSAHTHTSRGKATSLRSSTASAVSVSLQLIIFTASYYEDFEFKCKHELILACKKIQNCKHIQRHRKGKQALLHSEVVLIRQLVHQTQMSRKSVRHQIIRKSKQAIKSAQRVQTSTK